MVFVVGRILKVILSFSFLWKLWSHSPLWHFVVVKSISLRIVFGCSQWVSTHPWVMLICAISLPTNRAYSGNTLHFTCFSFLDSVGLYFWIPLGMWFLMLLHYLLTPSVFTFCILLLNVCCAVQLETLLKFFPMPSYRNLTLQCLTEVFHNTQVDNMVLFALHEQLIITVYVSRLQHWTLGIFIARSMLRCTIFSWYSCRCVSVWRWN